MDGQHIFRVLHLFARMRRALSDIDNLPTPRTDGEEITRTLLRRILIEIHLSELSVMALGDHEPGVLNPASDGRL